MAQGFRETGKNGSCRRQRRSASPITPEPSAASCTANPATERKTLSEQVGAKLATGESKSKKYQHEIKSGVIRDCTRTDPEYVWGDEGPISE
jgi:hypothetical protein